jgi:transcriptional regulator with XRE-family HTH domain
MLWSLRPIRVFLHQDQRYLAESAGLDQPYVSRLENGGMPRCVADVAALAKALGVSDSVLVADAITLRRDGSVEVSR